MKKTGGINRLIIHSKFGIGVRRGGEDGPWETRTKREMVQCEFECGIHNVPNKSLKPLLLKDTIEDVSKELKAEKTALTKMQKKFNNLSLQIQVERFVSAIAFAGYAWEYAMGLDEHMYLTQLWESRFKDDSAVNKGERKIQEMLNI